MDEKMSKGHGWHGTYRKNEVLEENTCPSTTFFTTNWLALDWTRAFGMLAGDCPSNVNFS
jgi:hypothetical protein